MGTRRSLPGGIHRRGFLEQSGRALLTLGLLQLAPLPPGRAAARPGEPAAAARQAFRDWRDVWRRRLAWDRVVHSSHARANCVSACSWNVFVRGGIAWREEQNAIYAASEPGVPDFNPRGCQKGACYTDLMYAPSRVLHPLERAGERGSGRWRRISWERALERIADAIIDAALESGTGAVVYDHGTTNVDFGADTAGEMRLFDLLNATSIDSWAGVGDMPHGLVQTWGMYNVEGTSDDWFKSDYIVVWVANPGYTRIPEVHFMHEARYRGARLVVIAPDYNATAVHADTWLNPRVGTDTALALAMAQVILAEGRHDEVYVREQTDLPILVREDDGRYLREADLRAGGRENLLYFWDAAAGQLAPVPGCEGEGGESLALGPLRPALSGRYPVQLADRSPVHVRPLLEVLRERLDRDYTPERASAITGVGAGAIRRVARELAAAGSAMIFPGLGSCKHYHGDLMQRSQILLMALTGNQGKSGGGLRVVSWWPVMGPARVPRRGAAAPARRVPRRGGRARLGADPARPRHRSAGLRLHRRQPAAPLARAAGRAPSSVAQAPADRGRELQGERFGDVRRVRDSAGGEIDLSTFYDRWSRAGRFHESNAKGALDGILRETPITGNKGFDEAARTGLLPVLEVSGGPHSLYALGTDHRAGRTLHPHDRFVRGRHAWPTLSGRQQFLIDHPWYAEVGETLPVHKEPPRAGGAHPLRLTGGHTRWSIHATWRDSSLLLRLQRGEPAVWIASEDARQRGIADGDRVRVFNDVGAFEAIAKVAPTTQPGQAIIYHAWEPYQFRRGRGQQEPVPAPWKPLHLAGGQGQLHYRAIYGAPGHAPRAQTVEITRV